MPNVCVYAYIIALRPLKNRMHCVKLNDFLLNLNFA